MLRPLGLVLLLVGLTARLTAQDYRYELGGSVSSSYYLGDIGRRGLIAPQALGIALELRRPVSLRWALMGELALRGLRGKADYAADAFPSSAVGSREFHRTLLDLALGGEFNFFPYSARERYLGTRSWTPFLGVGLGLAGGMSDHRLQLLPGVYARLGLKLRLSTRWGLTASWLLRRTFSDRLEGLEPSVSWMADPFGLDGGRSLKGHDSYGYWSVGVHYSLSPQRRYSCD
jgi:hypothetical protein